MLKEFVANDGRDWGTLRNEDPAARERAREKRERARQKAVEKMVKEIWHPQLYQSPNVAGIVAVLTPLGLKTTQELRRKGWSNARALCPSPKTFVFVTEEVEPSVREHIGPFAFEHKVAGTIGRLE